MQPSKNPSAIARIEVRFHDCDPLGIVWHGNYVKYFEAGREAFGNKYGLDYMELYINGFSTPVVHLESNFKKVLQYRDVALVEAIFRKTEAAKIIFDYIVRKENTGEVVCTASTTQVFVASGTLELSLVIPEIFAKWKQQKGLV